MRFLTGHDRALYEQLIAEKASLDAENAQLRIRLLDLQERLRSLDSLLDSERRRAEIAIDQLLTVRGVGPVTPPPVIAMHADNPLAEDPELAQQIEKAMIEYGPTAVFDGAQP